MGGLIALLAAPSLASNGNPRIPSSTPGAGTALVFCNAKPYQDDTTTSGSLNLLTTPINYFIDTAAYPDWTKYGVTSTPLPTGTGYLLLKNGSIKYAVVSFTLGSPVGPADESISSITWYTTGNPDPPSTIQPTAGFETAKITWSLNPNPAMKRFDYSSIEITIKKNENGTWTNVPATGNTTTSVLNGSPTSYLLGELIDGRTLTPNTEYSVTLVGKVKGKADGSVTYTSSPATQTFTTLSGGAVSPYPLTLKPGLNSFAMPFAPDANNKWYVGTTPITNALGLVQAINLATTPLTASPASIVSSFGTWDSTGKKIDGVMISTLDAGTQEQLTNRTLKQGVGYQLYLKGSADVTVTIKNTL